MLDTSVIILLPSCLKLCLFVCREISRNKSKCCENKWNDSVQLVISTDLCKKRKIFRQIDLLGLPFLLVQMKRPLMGLCQILNRAIQRAEVRKMEARKSKKDTSNCSHETQLGTEWEPSSLAHRVEEPLFGPAFSCHLLKTAISSACGYTQSFETPISLDRSKHRVDQPTVRSHSSLWSTLVCKWASPNFPIFTIKSAVEGETMHNNNNWNAV